MSLTLYVLYVTIASLLAMCLVDFFVSPRRTFRTSRLLMLLVVPVLGCLGLTYFFGTTFVVFFFASCLVGTMFEYVFGFAFHRVLGEHFWKYDRMSIGGYTSVLAPPLWGVGGSIFFVLAHYIM